MNVGGLSFVRKGSLPFVAFALTFIVLVPSAMSLPQHGDERCWVWKAGYYVGKLAKMDFSKYGSDEYSDPGLTPNSYWAVEQPMGSHLLYGVIMKMARTEPPARPYSYDDATMQGPETAVPSSTLRLTRLVAVFCAALGLALITFRLGWRGLLGIGLFLAVPHVRGDLARAWAEGPLMLGFGLCAASWGSRWFAPACGLAAAFKLTALPLWPLAFWHGLGRSRLAHFLAVLAAAAVWSVLTPPSLFVGGLPLLIIQLLHRALAYASQSAQLDGPAGLFLPTRYLWPFELLFILAVVMLLPLLWRRLHQHSPLPVPDGKSKS